MGQFTNANPDDNVTIKLGALAALLIAAQHFFARLTQSTSTLADKDAEIASLHGKLAEDDNDIAGFKAQLATLQTPVNAPALPDDMAAALQDILNADVTTSQPDVPPPADPVSSDASDTPPGVGGPGLSPSAPPPVSTPLSTSTTDATAGAPAVSTTFPSGPSSATPQPSADPTPLGGNPDVVPALTATKDVDMAATTPGGLTGGRQLQQPTSEPPPTESATATGTLPGEAASVAATRNASVDSTLGTTGGDPLADKAPQGEQPSGEPDPALSQKV